MKIATVSSPMKKQYATIRRMAAREERSVKATRIGPDMWQVVFAVRSAVSRCGIEQSRTINLG